MMGQRLILAIVMATFGLHGGVALAGSTSTTTCQQDRTWLPQQKQKKEVWKEIQRQVGLFQRADGVHDTNTRSRLDSMLGPQWCGLSAEAVRDRLRVVPLFLGLKIDLSKRSKLDQSIANRLKEMRMGKGVVVLDRSGKNCFEPSFGEVECLDKLAQQTSHDFLVFGQVVYGENQTYYIDVFLFDKVSGQTETAHSTCDKCDESGLAESAAKLSFDLIEKNHQSKAEVAQPVPSAPPPPATEPSTPGPALGNGTPPSALSPSGNPPASDQNAVAAVAARSGQAQSAQGAEVHHKSRWAYPLSPGRKAAVAVLGLLHGASLVSGITLLALNGQDAGTCCTINSWRPGSILLVGSVGLGLLMMWPLMPRVQENASEGR